MNTQVDDQMVLISEYYPVGIISQSVPEKGAAENVKTRRRRRSRKNKGGEGGGLMRKRKLSEEQASALEKSFDIDHNLESERKDRLAAELGMEPRQVAVWFQNRRVRWKNKMLEEEYNKLRSEHEAAVVEKCRLESEIIKMKEQLNETKKEIERLSLERPCNGFTSSPSPSMSVDTNMEPPFLGHEFAEDLGNAFYLQDNSCGLEWDNILYYV